MELTIALVGNPNSGKTTLFNALTGSKQYVGNWPGVTIEKKEGVYQKDEEVVIMDLPGIYSLSPYTPEEVVSRDYILEDRPDVIINVIDASNIERNLYLSTQLAETEIPVILAFNMMDVVEKRGDELNTELLSRRLGFPIVEVSALKNKNIDALIVEAKKLKGKKGHIMATFDRPIEEGIATLMKNVSALQGIDSPRWYAIKLLEEDNKLHLELTDRDRKIVNREIERLKKIYDDDGEGYITDARYNYVTDTIEGTIKKVEEDQTPSDKIDSIMTHKIWALPIFALIMTFVYYISAKVVGGPITDWINEVFFAEIIGENFRSFLISIGTSQWLVSLVIDGIFSGVGAVLGFLPMIATLYFFLAILEDVGYMSRIAFILDRVFRKFGLSGKSFIPILIGTGCSVPGIMATRTIESKQDRRMTIIVASFMPCGAKTEIIALFVASFGLWYFAPIAYFAGILAVIISGTILKKTAPFQGDISPFIMELPEYHMPMAKNVFKSVYDRCKSFVVKAGTIILLASVVLWFLTNISIHGEFASFSNYNDSILAAIGKLFAPLFTPLGFGNWRATVASAAGLLAKEAVVSTYGVTLGFHQPLKMAIATQFTFISALSFMLFNQLNIPCFGAVGAIHGEMQSGKWTAFALIYQLLFAYTISLMIYQFGKFFVSGFFSLWTVVAIVLLVIYLYLLFRPAPETNH